MAAERVTALGYEFANIDDAVLAQAEVKKIDYLKAHLDQGDADTVKALYDKAIDDNFFRSPVGMNFLSELREYMIDTLDFTEDEVRPVPIYLLYDGNSRKKSDAKKEEKKEKVGFLFVSVVLNIALVIAVIIMFWIATNTDQPNIINYETVLTDKYATWEQDLSTRESRVREAEKALKENGVIIETQETSENGD